MVQLPSINCILKQEQNIINFASWLIKFMVLSNNRLTL